MHSESRSLVERANLAVQQSIMFYNFRQDLHFTYAFAHAIYMLNRRECLDSKPPMIY